MWDFASLMKKRFLSYLFVLTIWKVEGTEEVEEDESMQVVLHEDKKYYPSHEEVFLGLKCFYLLFHPGLRARSRDPGGRRRHTAPLRGHHQTHQGQEIRPC